MIYLDILNCFESALGTSLDPAQRMSVVEKMAINLGGELRYFQSLPKLRSRASINEIGTEAASLSSKEIARRTGLHIRTIQRMRKQ